MKDLKPLREMDRNAATDAFDSEILGPFLALGFLDDADDPAWEVLAVLYGLYQPRVRGGIGRLLELTRAHRGARADELERTVSMRIEHRADHRSPEPIRESDREAVARWLDPVTRGARRGGILAGFWESARRFFFEPEMHEDFDQLQKNVAALAKAGDLRRERAAEVEIREAKSPAEKAAEKAPEKAAEKAAEKTPERAAEKAAERAAEKTPEKVLSPPKEKALVLPTPEVAPVDVERIKAKVERDIKHPPLDAASAQLLELELAFSSFRVGNKPGVLVIPELAPDQELWFIGDMHGDLVGFEAAMDHIRNVGRPHRTIVFLGDVVDDGFHVYELILRLFEELTKAPARCLFIAGNHDEALGSRGEGAATRFVSSVDPGDFASWLNERLSTPGVPPNEKLQVIHVANLFQQLVARAPRAMFLAGGLFAAHAGFPHTDLWDKLDTPEALTTAACLNDFAWNRWADQATKMPNRMSSQSQFGAKDFQGFCERAAKTLGLPVNAMIRGHDHVTDTRARFERKTEVRRASYEGRILTINNMSINMPREVSPLSEPGSRHPVLARWRAGETLPTPVILDVPDALAAWYAPTCTVCQRPNPTGSARCKHPARTGEGLCDGELRRPAS